MNVALSDAALHYARQLGLEVFPLAPGGKTPITAHGHKDATTNLGQINSWWQARPEANVGAPIPPGLLVLDLDGPEAFSALKAKGFGLPSTVTTKTPRGYHFWFTCRTPCQRKVGILPGIDLRAPGSCVVLPPSRLSNGSKYDWEVLPNENSFTEAPDWLIDLAAPKGLTVRGGVRRTRCSGRSRGCRFEVV